MKKFLLIVVLMGFLFSQSGIGNAVQEDITSCGQFAVQLAKLMGLGNLSESDAVSQIKAKGIDIGDPTKALSKKEMADILAKILNFDMKTAENMDIANQGKATIIAVEGDVEVKVNKASQWAKAAIGMELNEESSIRTGAGSYADIKVGMIGSVKVKENTELSLESLQAKNNGSENIILNITIGEMLVNVQGIPPKTNWTTVTPTTVAAVRGTIYTVSVHPTKTELTEVSEQR